MIIEFNNFINENLSNQELAEDLKGANFINIDFNEKNKNWDISYCKNGKKFRGGSFNSTTDAHEFLNDNNIDYNGRDAYLTMKKFRDKNDPKILFPKYQKEIINRGIKDML